MNRCRNTSKTASEYDPCEWRSTAEKCAANFFKEFFQNGRDDCSESYYNLFISSLKYPTAEKSLL